MKILPLPMILSVDTTIGSAAPVASEVKPKARPPPTGYRPDTSSTAPSTCGASNRARVLAEHGGGGGSSTRKGPHVPAHDRHTEVRYWP